MLMKQLNEKLFKNTKLIKILKQKASVLDMILKQFPHVSNETASDYVTLQNTAKAPMEIEAIPQTSQETTTGKNKWNDNAITSVTNGSNNNGDVTSDVIDKNSFNLSVFNSLTLTIGTYVISADIRIVSGSATFAKLNDGISDGTQILSPTLSGSFQKYAISKTYNSDTNLKRLLFQFNGTNAVVEIKNIQIENNSSYTSYEPYTGGIPAPNPDFPMDIHRTTGEQKIKIVNANLFNKNNVTTGYINANGTITSSDNYATSDFIEIDSSIRYEKTVTNSPRIKLFDKSKNLINSDSISDIASFGTAGTFSIPYEKAKYIRFTTRIDQPDSTVDKVMFATEGTLPSSYEENEETTYPISLGTKEMFNINNVSDGFVYDETTDKFYIERKNGKVVLNGSESDWIDDGGGAPYKYAISNIKNPPSNSYTEVFCNNYYPIPYSDNWNNYDYLITRPPYNTASKGIKFKNKDIGSLNDFKSWLSTHNTIVVYQLANATLEEITDTTLISQLRAIKNALSMQGTTHIISTATGENLLFLIKASAVKSFE